MTEEVFDNWAEVYDIIYSEKSEEDVEFYLGQAKESEGPVLEIGCGTGRIYLELLRNGIDAFGLDISHRMLEVLREKAEERGLEPRVFQADMRNFSFDKKFACIIIPFGTFLHNLTVKDQLNTLSKCKEHLVKDGKLILNFFNPDPYYIAENYGEEVESTFEHEGDAYTLIEYTEFEDDVEKIAKAKNTLKKNEETVWSISFKIALITKRHFELLLRLMGFSSWKVYKGFNSEEDESSDQELVWIVEK